DEENRIGFLFRSLEGKARKTLETYLLTKTKDNSLSYKDFCGYIKDSVYYRKRDAAVKRLNTELVLPNNLPALAKYSLSILLPKTPLLNRQIDLAIRTDKATFRDEEDRIGFLFRSLKGKARKTLETYLLTKTKDDSLSYKDFYGYIKDLLAEKKLLLDYTARKLI
ncbi:hypothetical protein L249_6803, partial [Ophiocordyceps polyrhachis-furcata BCC 54312]